MWKIRIELVRVKKLPRGGEEYLRKEYIYEMDKKVWTFAEVAESVEWTARKFEEEGWQVWKFSITGKANEMP